MTEKSTPRNQGPITETGADELALGYTAEDHVLLAHAEIMRLEAMRRSAMRWLESYRQTLEDACAGLELELSDPAACLNPLTTQTELRVLSECARDMAELHALMAEVGS